MENTEATAEPAPVESEPPGRFSPAPRRPWLGIGLSVYALAFPFILLSIDPVPRTSGSVMEKLGAVAKGAKEQATPSSMEEAFGTWGSPQAVATQLLLALVVAGAAATLVLSFSFLIFPATRSKLQIGRVTERPPPAVRLMDLFVALLITKFLLTLIIVAYMQVFGRTTFSIGEHVLLPLAVQLPLYVLTICFIVGMARMRGGQMGAAGIWPFWETPGLKAPRDVKADVFMGVCAFVLCFWLLVITSFLNKYAMAWVGVVQDQNPIVEVLTNEIGGSQRVWIYAAIFFTVVVVAPIAEEILFRGLLYNFLRRYLDRWTAACAGALLFSFFHGVLADQWALFVLGLVLTVVYERSGRLLPAVILHAVNNSVAVGYMLVVQSQQ